MSESENFQDALHRAMKKIKEKPSRPMDGRIPPQSRDVEEAILGAVLLEKEAFRSINGLLTPDMFYVDEHKEVFTSCCLLHDAGRPIDLLTVVEDLLSRGKLEFVGGPFGVTELTNRVGSSDNIEDHAKIVYEKWLGRKLITVTSEIQAAAYDPTQDVFDVKAALEKSLKDVDDASNLGGYTSIRDVFADVLKIKFDSDESSASRIRTGIDAFDDSTNGFQPGELIIIAGRPGMGKSIMANNIALTTAGLYDVPVGLVNLEMSNKQVTERMTAAASDISASDIRRNEFRHQYDKDKFFNSKIGDYPIFMDTGCSGEIRDITRIAREMHRRENIGVFIVDYLQLAKVKDEKNREREISIISRTLKLLSKELNIPVIALSQLSRAVEARGGMKRPMLSDLRESGSLEQDADMVIMLYRAEYYGFDYDEDNNPTENMVDVSSEKNRHGGLVEVKAFFDKRTLQFKNLPIKFAH